MAALIGDRGPTLARWAVVYAVALAAFALARSPLSEELSGKLRSRAISWPMLLAHIASIATFGALSRQFFLSAAGPGSDTALAVVWSVSALCLPVTALATFFPIGLWPALARSGGSAWAFAGATAAVVAGLAQFGGVLWSPTTKLTFACVQTLLRPLIPGLLVNPKAMEIGSSSFSVIINPECSGLEGVALIFAFGAGWLAFFRREYRFPHALLLLPAGVSAVWVFNCFRITALILIGHAGAAGLAMGGFHSQAGWIGFNTVAVAFTVAGRRIGWMRHRAVAASAAGNPVAPYLVPFLAILAAAMVSKAASSGAFEWLYGARLLAAAVALWWFRREYAAMDWRAGWRAPAIGAAVFLIWIGAERIAGGGTASPLPAVLASLTPAARIVWLTLRVLAAVITVPIAEELAFRGFVLRRVIAPDFECIDPRRYTISALAVSSVLFGLLHGSRWFVGILAGLLYAYGYVRRGRIGEAALAHATTNALLAAWVLWRGEWGLW